MDDGAARQQLGFEARTPLDRGLRRTIQWYQGGAKVNNLVSK